MDSLKNRKKRLGISLIAALFLTVVTGTGVQKNIPALAWWGSMYPQFCFAENEEENTDEIEPEVKISFWLAKQLEWWYHK